MIRTAVLLLATGLIAAAPAARRTNAMHATGTFEVRIAPEASAEAPADGLPTARMGIAKTFAGGMTGMATGTMLSAGKPAPGQASAYVAVDQFHGSVDGRDGGFLLLHRGTMDRGGRSDLSISIAPDTGTGALRGISGSLSIDIRQGVHHYDLTYTLPVED